MSSRDMTINQIKAADKDFGAKHTISVKCFNDGGRASTRDLNLSIRDELLSAIKNLEYRIDKLETRIDNLVKLNNLKE